MKKLFAAVMIPTIIAIGVITYNFNALYNSDNIKTEYTAELRNKDIPVLNTAKNIKTENTENIEESKKETESVGTQIINTEVTTAQTSVVQGTKFTQPVATVTNPTPVENVPVTTEVETKKVNNVQNNVQTVKENKTTTVNRSKQQTTQQPKQSTAKKSSTKTSTQNRSQSTVNTASNVQTKPVEQKTENSVIQTSPEETQQIIAELAQIENETETNSQPVTNTQPQEPVTQTQTQPEPIEQTQTVSEPTSTTDFSQYVYTGDDGYVHFLYTGTGEKNIIVPEGVQTIDGFSRLHKPNTEIEYIRLPKSLEEIMLVQAFSEEGDNQWYYALYECINLKRVDLEDTWHYQYRATADGKRVYRPQNITAWQYGVRVPYNESDYFK